MKPYMSKPEIIRRLRNMGGVSEKNYKILAELNSCRVAQVLEVLSTEEALTLMPQAGFDAELATSLYLDGLSDRKIAKILCVASKSVWDWRTENGLPPNNIATNR